MVRQRRVIEFRVLMAIAGALLLAGSMVGCGSGVGEGNADGRGGERGSAAATDEATTAPEEDQPASGAAREQVGLDAEAVSPGGAYLPAGFGEGSLWATDVSICNDTMSVSGSASSSGGASFSSSAQAMCDMPNKMLLKRLDPRTGEEVAALDVSGEVQLAAAQELVRLDRELVALGRLLADREQAHLRVIAIEQLLGEDRAHVAELEQVLRPGIGARPGVDEHGGAAAGGDDGSDRGPEDARKPA